MSQPGAIQESDGWQYHKRYFEPEDGEEWPLDYSQHMESGMRNNIRAKLTIEAHEAGDEVTQIVTLRDDYSDYVFFQDFDDPRFAYMADQLGYNVVDKTTKKSVDTDEYRDGVKYSPAFRNHPR